MLVVDNHQKYGNATVFCITVILFIAFSSGTAMGENHQLVYRGDDPCPHLPDLMFDPDKANNSVSWQTNLGPRLPGSNASLNLRNSIVENLTEFTFEEQSHQRQNFTLTNLIGTFKPLNSTGQNVVFVAHYDSRYQAERDENESMRNKPIDGANDGASGVAVLIELGKVIPQLNLSHDVTLFFSDAEDQGITGGLYPETWAYGARGWVENLTEQYIANISAYIVIDMIGDKYLDFTKIRDTSEELWETVIPLTAALGMIEDELDCNGELGKPMFDPNSAPRGVIDDHTPAHDAGIPTINFIDINYGEDAKDFGGHWHTHNDTADKVSAESLGLIGSILELGLRTQSWNLITGEDINNNITEESLVKSNQEPDVQNNNEIKVEKSKFIGYVSIAIVSFTLFLILIGDISIKL